MAKCAVFQKSSAGDVFNNGTAAGLQRSGLIHTSLIIGDHHVDDSMGISVGAVPDLGCILLFYRSGAGLSGQFLAGKPEAGNRCYGAKRMGAASGGQAAS